MIRICFVVVLWEYMAYVLFRKMCNQIQMFCNFFYIQNLWQFNVKTEDSNVPNNNIDKECKLQRKNVIDTMHSEIKMTQSRPIEIICNI